MDAPVKLGPGVCVLIICAATSAGCVTRTFPKISRDFGRGTLEVSASTGHYYCKPGGEKIVARWYSVKGTLVGHGGDQDLLWLEISSPRENSTYAVPSDFVWAAYDDGSEIVAEKESCRGTVRVGSMTADRIELRIELQVTTSNGDVFTFRDSGSYATEP